MAAPSQEYLDLLAAKAAAGTLTERQKTNYANAVRNGRYGEPAPRSTGGGQQPPAPVVAGQFNQSVFDQYVSANPGLLSGLEQLNSYSGQEALGGGSLTVNQATVNPYYNPAPQAIAPLSDRAVNRSGGDAAALQDLLDNVAELNANTPDIRRGSEAEQEYNAQVQSLIDNSGVNTNIIDGGKNYNLNVGALTDAYRAPRTDAAGQFGTTDQSFSLGDAIELAATTAIGAGVGAGILGPALGAAGNAVAGIGSQGTLAYAANPGLWNTIGGGLNAAGSAIGGGIGAGVSWDSSTSTLGQQAQNVINNAISNPTITNLATNNPPELEAGTIVDREPVYEINPLTGIPQFIGYQEVVAGERPNPTEEAGGGGADSNDTASAEASQSSSAASGAPLDQALENQDVWTWNGVELVNVDTGETREVPNPSRLEEGVLYNGDTEPLGEETPEEEESNAIFGSGNPFINPMTGEGYFGDSVLPTADAELSQGQVLDGNPTEQVAYDPDAVFGSDDPNIDPRTGEAYVDYTTPDDLGGLSSGGVGTDGTGTTGNNGSGDGNDGTGDGPGGDGSGDGGLEAAGLLAGSVGANNWEDFMAVPNYTYQLLGSPNIRMMDFMADYLPNRNTRR